MALLNHSKLNLLYLSLYIISYLQGKVSFTYMTINCAKLRACWCWNVRNARRAIYGTLIKREFNHIDHSCYIIIDITKRWMPKFGRFSFLKIGSAISLEILRRLHITKLINVIVTYVTPQARVLCVWVHNKFHPPFFFIAFIGSWKFVARNSASLNIRTGFYRFVANCK